MDSSAFGRDFDRMMTVMALLSVVGLVALVIGVPWLIYWAFTHVHIAIK